MKLDITWHDPNGIEDGYKVYRGEGAPVDLNNLPEPVADLPADAMLYMDTNITYGGEYYYAIAAYKEDELKFGEQLHAFAVPDANIYVSAQGYHTEGFDSEGNLLWEYANAPSSGYTIAADSQGYTYTTNYATNQVMKLDQTGVEVWKYTLGNQSRVVSVDIAGNVYAGDYNSILTKLSPFGDQLWTVKQTGYIIAITTDDDLNVYAGGRNLAVIKYDPDGNEVWSFTGHTDYINSIAVDENGYVYTASSDMTVRKLDPDGNEVWSFTGHTNGVSGVAVDRLGNVFSCSGTVVKKLDPDGNLIWDFNGHTGSVNDVAVDYQGNVYSASNDRTVRKVNENGVEVLSIDVGVFVASVAVTPIQLDLYEPSYFSGSNV